MGNFVEGTMEQHTALEALHLLKQDGELHDDWERSFADSVDTQFKQKHGLTTKQWYYIDKIVRRQEARIFNTIESIGVGAKYHKPHEFLTKAGTHLKKPSITFKTEPYGLHMSLGYNGTLVQLASGDGLWYGKITADHVVDWSPAIESNSAMKTAVLALLDEFEEDPVAMAAKYGQAAAHCCFCNTEINSKESLAVGYGPKCAKNFGLPWGKKA